MFGKFSIALVSITISIGVAAEAACIKDGEKIFSPDGEHVVLARGDDIGVYGRFAVYRAALAVNTDGAPNSYNPFDLLGERDAINRFDNGISVRDSKDGKRKLSLSERVTVIGKWRDNNWVVPKGYKITWQNVIAKTPEGKPCIFQSGAYKGFFGSLTALKNNLSARNAGECQSKNQLDQRFIPSIVLRGNDNPLRGYGAGLGDLVVAINPDSGALVGAVIGDTGDGDRIGEGSVALNMALLDRSAQPSTYNQAKLLDTGEEAMIVAVLPNSRRFNPAVPYSVENIRERIRDWAAAKGYETEERLKNAIVSCAEGL